MAETVSVGIIGCGSVMQHAYMPLLVNEIARGHAVRADDLRPAAGSDRRGGGEVPDVGQHPRSRR